MSLENASDVWSTDYLETNAACLFCGDEASTPEVDGIRDWFFECVPGKFALERCENCGSLFQPERLALSHLPHAYARYYTHSGDVSVDPSGGLRRMLKSAYVDWRFKGSRRPGAWLGGLAGFLLGGALDELRASYRFAPAGPIEVLDYGCGNGTFLQRMETLGNRATGVDFDPKAIETVRNDGGTAFTVEEADDNDWSSHFDFVSLAHVIEHVPDPQQLLRQIANWLKPGGTLFIEAPNADAAGLQMLGRYWRGLEAPRHLSIPSAKGIRIAAREAGFEIERQIVRRTVRSWLFEESLGAVPEEMRDEYHRKLGQIESETLENAEFLTFVLIKEQNDE